MAGRPAFRLAAVDRRRREAASGFPVRDR